jgi:ADP-ribose pyrophosphatase
MSAITDDKHLLEDTIASEQVWQGRLLDVRRDQVRLPDGAKGVREYVVHPGAVVVIGILDNGQLLFERQFRYPVGRVFLELPAGKIDAGENILNTAQRELLEETGYVAQEWRHLGVMHPCIGYSNERIEIFLARGLERRSAPQLDHGEHLDVLELSMEAALAAIRRGDLTDAKSITALFWAEKVMVSGW